MFPNSQHLVGENLGKARLLLKEERMMTGEETAISEAKGKQSK